MKKSFRIGYMCPFDNKASAELETRMRFQYCIEKNGHIFIPLNSRNYTFNTNIHADNLSLDFVFSHDTAFNPEKPVPNIYSTFFHWSPNGFLHPCNFSDYFEFMYKYDDVAGSYESDKIQQDCYNLLNYKPSFFKITSSVPRDFALKPQKYNARRLFYIGISATRYKGLIEYLNKNNMINIYGPKKNPFSGLTEWGQSVSYRGECPFDGRSAIKFINESGICLALNSPVHNSYDTVSNRLYEAAAGGAVIISDDNKYVRKYFRDSVFYVDITKSEDELVDDIKEIINVIQKKTDLAYEMANAAHEIFLKELVLDDQIDKLIDFTEQNKNRIISGVDNIVTIDIICFINGINDWRIIKNELSQQYYKNIHLIILAPSNIFESIKIDIKYSYYYFETNSEDRGKYFSDILSLLSNPYFMFIDKSTALHKNHIYKLVQTISTRNNLFAYSGTYIEYINTNGIIISYITLNYKKISKDEFLAFANAANMTIDDVNFCFHIEEIFSLSCCIFSKEILSYVVPTEVNQVSNAVHIYLAACSLIKAERLGRFVPIISSGYRCIHGQSITDEVFYHRKFYYKYANTNKIYFKELYFIFYKYDINIDFYKSHYSIYNKAFIISVIRDKIKEKLRYFPLLFFMAKSYVKIINFFIRRKNDKKS
jgi:hypothetical protein